MSKIFTSWIETLLRHRTVQVELCGDKVKREVVKTNPQGGILSSFLWNGVLNSLLLELRSRGFYVQAYADDLAVLVTGADMLWIRGMAQKAINIAENCALEQELQFSCKKTEIVLFTHKRNPDLGSLSMNGTKLELSKKTRLLGVTLDSKLTWKPHITRITRKATTALMHALNFYWLRQWEGHTESLLVGSGMSTQLVPLGKQKAILMFAMRQGNSYLYCKCQLTE